MKVVFTVGVTANTICDVSASPPISGAVEDLVGDSIIDKEPLYGAAAEGQYPSGNVTGSYVITARGSSATISASQARWAAAWALMQQVGTLVQTPPDGSATLTFANAKCKSVRRVYWKGVDLAIRYEFIINSCVTP